MAASWAGGLAGRKQCLKKNFRGVQGMVGEMTIQDLDPDARKGPLLV